MLFSAAMRMIAFSFALALVLVAIALTSFSALLSLWSFFHWPRRQLCGSGVGVTAFSPSRVHRFALGIGAVAIHLVVFAITVIVPGILNLVAFIAAGVTAAISRLRWFFSQGCGLGLLWNKSVRLDLAAGGGGGRISGQKLLLLFSLSFGPASGPAWRFLWGCRFRHINPVKQSLPLSNGDRFG
jgi:hypothetical protein